MSAGPRNVPDTVALTPEEAHALGLAEELRDRIQRERETARLLTAYLEISPAALEVEPAADQQADLDSF